MSQTYTFPLAPPTCNTHNKPCTRQRVNPNNAKGNAGRPYYICRLCDADNRGQFGPGFVTSDDAIGVYEGNPKCKCDALSRLGKAGCDTTIAGQWFVKCAAGVCGYWAPVRFGRG
ncbi:hypothetical protein K491DRAFT_605432 [Lophiostoma macrostomum CBS 122681]|uniref:GRF-like zinc ribbon domain-containing protein n=1 Tax=Lophiostoma macrostomum CBS 122681 TaxID=1314788 RepID=A0A6A6SZY5_9PLEO|nr:hypothetical protein K491DRAFT_605432 [Lophiostoma macrostomum CBS 122681]